jgi:hypothetical protein
MPELLTDKNVDVNLQAYLASIGGLGTSILGLTGIGLLKELKRGAAGSGPYSDVSLFEAANRIMTDLVILYGVRGLLKSRVFPFESYSVEFGHGNAQAHDVLAKAGDVLLIGEAFNVAPSFFPVKRNAALKKLRKSSSGSGCRVLLCNHDAVGESYAPRLRDQEHLVLVDIGDGTIRMVPNNGVKQCGSAPSSSGQLPQGHP